MLTNRGTPIIRGLGGTATLRVNFASRESPECGNAPQQPQPAAAQDAHVPHRGGCSLRYRLRTPHLHSSAPLLIPRTDKLTAERGTPSSSGHAAIPPGSWVAQHTPHNPSLTLSSQHT
eukprot:5126282-Prymnesium_polylepis.1